MSGGVPLGKAREYGQSNTIGYPSSLNVGILGSPSNRFSSAAANILMEPESRRPAAAETNAASQWPPKRAVSASPEDLYGMSTTLMPACFLKSSRTKSTADN